MKTEFDLSPEKVEIESPAGSAAHSSDSEIDMPKIPSFIYPSGQSQSTPFSLESAVASGVPMYGNSPISYQLEISKLRNKNASGNAKRQHN